LVTSATKAPPATLVTAIVVDAIALALIFWQARRAGVSNRYAPTVGPPAAYPPTPPLPAR
jgi:hypothetical protein